MCGIFGYNIKPGSVSEGARAILSYKLAEGNDERGGHSWGVGIVADGALTTLERGLGKMQGHAHLTVGAETLFGHTRWATHGGKTIANAHPFEVGKIVGAHNGIVYSHRELLTKYDRDFEVDSMHLFAHLNEGLSFEEIEGYGAIEWIEKDAPVTGVYLSRLKNGELSVAYLLDDDGNEDFGVVWSSDADHLIAAVYAAGLDCKFYKVEEGTVYHAKPEGLFLTGREPLMLSRSTTITPGVKRYKRWEDYAEGYAGGSVYSGVSSYPPIKSSDKEWDAYMRKRYPDSYVGGDSKGWPDSRTLGDGSDKKPESGGMLIVNSAAGYDPTTDGPVESAAPTAKVLRQCLNCDGMAEGNDEDPKVCEHCGFSIDGGDWDKVGATKTDHAYTSDEVAAAVGALKS